MGNNRGAAITMTATGGKNIPATSRNTLMMNISAQRLISSAAIAVANDWVMYSDESAKENSSADAMIIMIMTLSRMADPKIPIKGRTLNKRYTTMTTSKVSIAPAPAASDGVATPPYSTYSTAIMMISMGNTRGNTASLSFRV